MVEQPKANCFKAKARPYNSPPTVNGGIGISRRFFMKCVGAFAVTSSVGLGPGLSRNLEAATKKIGPYNTVRRQIQAYLIRKNAPFASPSLREIGVVVSVLGVAL